MRLMTYLTLSTLFVSGVVSAEPASPTSLSLFPEQITLLDARSHQQLVLTGTDAEGELRDFTHEATYVSSDTGVCKVEHGIVIPTGNGSATVTTCPLTVCTE